MSRTVRHVAVLLVLLVLSAGCGDSEPTLPPTVTSQLPELPAQPSPPPPPPAHVPPLSGPARTFSFDRGLSYPVRDYTRHSRLVLYDNSAFVLQYLDAAGVAGEYRGAYTEANGVLLFVWEGWSSAGSWGATGTLKDNSLTVQYNEIMHHVDFDDAVYVLTVVR
jgi:hypothetical protein